jgi:pyridoxamine 5'-phosphate oxidase
MTKPGLDIAQIRSDYQLAALNETETGDDPLLFFKKWFQEAQEAEITEVNAMTLATTDESGMPHARIVLLKGMDPDSFLFFSNYQSNKGKQVAAQNQAALLFFWKELERQVRIEGKVEKLAPVDSDTYFNSRPRNSRISAIASPQSQIIPNRQFIEEQVNNLRERYEAAAIQRPEYWGGYKLVPDYLEFWQGRSNRLHDRIVFEKNKESGWKKYRLAP